MNIYKCTDCNYETRDKSNFLKHNSTKKHLKKVNENTKSTKNIQKHSLKNLPENEHQCPYCLTFYSTSSNLSRHKKLCSDKSQLENSYKSELERHKLTNEIEKYKQKVSELNNLRAKDTEMNKQLQNENAYLKTLIENAGAVIKTSVSALSYVAKNYKDAPKLQKLTDYSYITYDDDNDEFDLLKTIFDHYRDNILDQYLGNIIVSAYKKENPAEQSLWNSDTVRLTYLVKDIINKKTDWTVDKKGIKTSKFIIDPLLAYIRVLLTKYIDENGLENYVTESYMQLKKRTDDMQAVAEIITVISNNSLSEQILKYIAPHFYLTKNDELVAV